MANIYLLVLIVGLVMVGAELFSLISRKLDLVCLGFILVFGALIGTFSRSLLLVFGVIVLLSVSYFLIFQKVVHRWVRETSKL